MVQGIIIILNKVVIKTGVFLAACVAFGFSMVYSQTVTYYQTGDEFNGPYASWKNIKTDYNAKGDGSTDDAANINQAVNALKNTQLNNYSVLYFPAGTYVINSSVINTGRSQGDEYSGMEIIGEDPATTVIKWNGATNGTMFKLDGWNFKVSRLAFNGNSKAGIGIQRGDAFGTGVEMSDMIFTDFPSSDGYNSAVAMAGPTSQGQAEQLFLRCKFIRCAIGISAPNQNSLDLWVWDCLFQNCGKGNEKGGFQFYNNVFIGSTVWDIGGNSWQPSAMVNNISINSKDFFTPTDEGPWYVQNNKIYHCTKSYSTPSSIYSLSANGAVWINNTISTTVPASVELPATPPRVVRKIFEVTSAANIQSQILAAYNEPAGSKPIVHIPKGTYTVSTTIIVPNNKEITIVGDGSGGFGTYIKGGAPTIRLMAPSRATIQDMDFDGNPGILVEVSDQPGSRVLGKMFNPQGLNADRRAGQALIVDSIEQSNLLFAGSIIQRFNSGVLVRGGKELGAGNTTSGQIAFLSGAHSHGRGIWDVQNGGKLFGQGFWYEADITGSTKHLLDLTSNSKGSIALAAMFWCHNAPDNYISSIDNFNGVYTSLANKYLRYGNPMGIKLTGSGQNCYVLQGYTVFYDAGTLAQNWLDQTSPDAPAAFLSSGHYIGTYNAWKKSSGATPDTASMGKLIAQTRSLRIEKEVPCPAGVTDVKLYRVSVTSDGGLSARFLAKAPAIQGVLNVPTGKQATTSHPVQILSFKRSVQIPSDSKRISVYDFRGRVIWDKVIHAGTDLQKASEYLAAQDNRNVYILKIFK